ncbi:hypothetical protein P7C70_g7587, partial [Phenoliferia sp. Uapishka_3]
MKVLLLAGLGLAEVAFGNTSPPISARITSNWVAPPLVTLYLESVAQENAAALFPFINYLVTNSNPTTKPPLGLPVDSFQGFNPAFTPLLRPNESYAILEDELRASQLMARAGEAESLRLAVAAREGSVVVEGMRILAVEREVQLGVSR